MLAISVSSVDAFVGLQVLDWKNVRTAGKPKAVA
jgi:hypothetical protein